MIELKGLFELVLVLVHFKGQYLLLLKYEILEKLVAFTPIRAEFVRHSGGQMGVHLSIRQGDTKLCVTQSCSKAEEGFTTYPAKFTGPLKLMSRSRPSVYMF